MSTPNQHSAADQPTHTAKTFSRDDLIEHINQLILQGQNQVAWAALEQWNTQFPQDALAFVFAANIMRREQNWQRAIELSNQALKFEANFYPAMLEKARIYVDKNDYPLACHAYLNVYQNYPEVLEYFNEWSDALIQIADYQTLLDVVNLQLTMGEQSTHLYFKAGLAHQYIFEHEKAIPYYEKLMTIDPSYPMLLNNLGAAYKETKQLEKALELLALEIKNTPNNFMALVNYSSVLQKMHDLDGALYHIQKAIKIEPNYAIAYNNLCLSQRELQQFDAAIQSAEQAVLIDPNYNSGKWNLAMSYLQAGRYLEGWQMHEYRWTGSGELRGNPHNLPVPEYDGSQDIFGKTIFIWGEQGFGDAIQFARYIPIMVEKLKQRGAIVKYCCFGLLQDLFTESFQHLFDDVIINDKHRPLPEFDYHLPLLKMPLLMQTLVETIPNQVPYLKPTVAAQKKWQDMLNADKNLKVGLVWTGSLGHQRNPFRAVGVDAYVPFKELNHISFYNLQFHSDDDVAKARAQGLDLIDYTSQMPNFNESAAFIKELDLVITVCTSVSHLSGALGVPTWVLLDTNPHWVWLLNRDDSPWYPHTKLYRQKEYRQWQPVLDRVYHDLKELAAQKTAKSSKKEIDKSKKEIDKSNKQTVNQVQTKAAVKDNKSDSHRIQLKEEELLELSSPATMGLKPKTKKVSPKADKSKPTEVLSSHIN